MLEQVVNELFEGTIVQTLLGNFLKEALTQKFEETAAPVASPALLLPSTLLLEGAEVLECLPHFSNP